MKRAQLVFTLLCVLAPSALLSQALPEDEDPPRLTPPPSMVPPSFTPPSRPPSGPPPASPSRPGRIATRPEAADTTIMPTSAAAEQEMAEEFSIPEMGTNEILELLADLTQKPILKQQSLPSVKISFYSQGPLTRSEAINAVESLLALNGIAITEVGETFLKAVPMAVITNQVAPRWEGSTLEAKPTQKVYEKLFQLEFLTTQEIAQLVQALMSQGAPVVFEKNNMLLVTDALVNLQRLESLLQVVDKPGKLNTAILFYQLKNITASDAYRRMEQIQQGPLKRQLEGNTAFDADDRTNQLLVFTHPSNEDLINQLVGKLDIDVAPLTETKVYSIRYANAVDVVALIEQVVTGQKQARDQQQAGSSRDAGAAAAARARQQQAASAQQAQIQTASNAAAAAARESASNLQFSDFLTIVADERANTIVASGTTNDLRYLDKLVEEIDTLLAQVRIEVVISEVNLSDTVKRGIDAFSIGYGRDLTGGPEGQHAADSPYSDQKFVFPGELYGIRLPGGVTWGPQGFSIESVFTTARTNSDVSILSAPTILTTHNREATVSIGERRPVITGVYTDTTGGARDQVSFEDIKLELKVTPLIGSDGVVQLEIDQLIERVVDTVIINENEQPVIGKRQAASYVSVNDGDLVVLGGLRQIDINETEGRVAILSRIPILGHLFRPKSDTERTSELIIFIRPKIIRTGEEGDFDAQEQLRTSSRTDEIYSYLESGVFRLPDSKEEAEEEDADAADPTRPMKFRN